MAIVACAEKYLGTPYVYGGNGPNSFDCSGFVKYVFKECGYSINRTASTQLSNGVSVAKSELQPGDIVFFRNKGDSHAASHVGIYVGGETFIHASSDTYQVEYSSLVPVGLSDGVSVESNYKAATGKSRGGLVYPYTEREKVSQSMVTVMTIRR